MAFWNKQNIDDIKKHYICILQKIEVSYESKMRCTYNAIT